MPTRFALLVRLTCLTSLLLAGCAAGRIQPSNETTSRILTAVATRATATQQATTADDATGEATATSAAPLDAASPTPAEPTATPQPPMIFARCIMRAETTMRREPEDAALVTASLRPSDIVTAYGRTGDGGWILAWNREITFGWIPSGDLGCSAPLEDLRPTQPDVLLTPRPTATPAEPVAGAATATPTSVTATAETPTPTETPTPEPTPTATPEVTPTVAEPTVTATMTATAPLPTPTPTPEATVAITPTIEPAPPTATVAATEAPTESLACVVAITQALNLRAGPDRTTRWLGQIRPGASFSATGRNADATWLYGATARGDLAWVIASALRCDGDPAGLPVVSGS